MQVEVPTQNLRQQEHTFFFAMAISMAIVVFIGFSRSFFLRFWFPEFQSLAAPETIFYVHGVFLTAVTAWAGLLTILSQLFRLMVSDTQAWLKFAGWAVSFAN